MLSADARCRINMFNWMLSDTVTACVWVPFVNFLCGRNDIKMKAIIAVLLIGHSRYIQ